jgi:serine/threonine-protein kinase RsbW
MTTPGSRALALRAAAATYPGRAEQVAAVRADLRLLLAGCPIADDVIHCASELAANAVRHSQSRLAGGTFIVRTEIYPGDYIWIEVEDDGGAWLEAAHDPERGHGLDIVRALASESGVEGDEASRVVWARLDWPLRQRRPAG